MSMKGNLGRVVGRHKKTVVKEGTKNLAPGESTSTG